MLSLWHDLRHALRLLRKTPGFTAVLLTLGLGIGACTAIYTVVYGVLLRPLPYPEPNRVMHLWQIPVRPNIDSRRPITSGRWAFRCCAAAASRRATMRSRRMSR